METPVNHENRNRLGDSKPAKPNLWKVGNVEQCEGELKHCKASLEQQINSTNAIIDSDLDPKLFMKKIW